MDVNIEAAVQNMSPSRPLKATPDVNKDEKSEIESYEQS